MRWAPVATPDLKRDLILFDGDCVLCARGARFVHKHDKRGRFAFVAIQSPFGRALAARFGIDPEQPETNLAAVNGRVFFKSDAALAVLAQLPGWRWSAAARVLPKEIRDALYDRVARNRFSWFGRRKHCWVGDPAFRSRILEHVP